MMIQVGVFPEHRNVKTIRRDGYTINRKSKTSSKEFVIH